MKNSQVTILVDFLCFTVRLEDISADEINPLRLRDWIETVFRFGSGKVEFDFKRALHGYAESYNKQGITYCFGGRDDIFIQMSGKGCRYWETLNPGETWAHYLRHLQTSFKHFHCSRLDIAADSFNLLKIRTIQNAVMKESFVSKWRDYLVNWGNKENGVYFGSSKSDFRLRIYDKTAERQREQCKDVPENWVRCEFQLRDDAACGFLDLWLGSDDLGGTFHGLLKNQLRFYSKYDGKNIDRMVLTSWWKKFLGDAAQLRLPKQGGMEYNLDSLERYIFRQAGSSIKTWLELADGDVTKLVSNVNCRELNERQQALIDSAEQIDFSRFHRPDYFDV